MTILTEIERLTGEQRELIGMDDKSALEQNLERKEQLIGALKAMPDAASGDEERALLEKIVRMERENIRTAQDELERLRAVMKKAQEGMMTVRAYDAFGAGVGATYIDKKH
ncbi:MAG: hypothetical protein LBH95_07890 [Oscillospiraceae bacterium]|nr:hypothetical protein [Oscillospiraceae bacterium]